MWPYRGLSSLGKLSFFINYHTDFAIKKINTTVQSLYTTKNKKNRIVGRPISYTLRIFEMPSFCNFH